MHNRTQYKSGLLRHWSQKEKGKKKKKRNGWASSICSGYTLSTVAHQACLIIRLIVYIVVLLPHFAKFKLTTWQISSFLFIDMERGRYPLLCNQYRHTTSLFLSLFPAETFEMSCAQYRLLRGSTFCFQTSPTEGSGDIMTLIPLIHLIAPVFLLTFFSGQEQLDSAKKITNDCIWRVFPTWMTVLFPCHLTNHPVSVLRLVRRRQVT